MRAPRKPVATRIKGLEIKPMAVKRLEPKNYSGSGISRETKAEIADLLGKVPSLIKPYLKLSAAKTVDGQKGHINAIGCRTIFPENPAINYNPVGNDYTGSIELWMRDVKKGDSFFFSFRVSCPYPGQWKVSTSETGHQYFNIMPLDQKVEFMIPSVKNDHGLALIRLEPQFQNYGSWTFTDVTVRRVSFN